MQLREVTSDGYKMDASQRQAEVRQSFTDDPPDGKHDIVYRFYSLTKKGRNLYAVMRYEKLEVKLMIAEFEADRVRFA